MTEVDRLGLGERVSGSFQIFALTAGRKCPMGEENCPGRICPRGKCPRGNVLQSMTWPPCSAAVNWRQDTEPHCREVTGSAFNQHGGREKGEKWGGSAPLCSTQPGCLARGQLGWLGLVCQFRESKTLPERVAQQMSTSSGVPLHGAATWRI